MSTKHKKIGLFNIVGLGAGTAIGSGIFVVLGTAIENTGRAVVPITAICVFYMLLAYWYNVALSSVFVIKGGDYSMKSMLLNPLLTGFGGWTSIIWAFGFTGYSIALTKYLSSLWPILGEHIKLSSSILLTIFFLLTIRGNRIVTYFQNTATVLLVIALFIFVGTGIGKVNFENFISLSHDGGFFHNEFIGVLSAIAIMGWACQGTTMGPVGAIHITKNPKRNIPLGIIIACVLVSIIYGLMSYVASGILPYDTVAGKDLSVVAKVIMSNELFAFFIIGGGACAIISSFLGVLVMIREPLASMADDGWLPNIFKKKSSDGYPYVCFLLVYIVALIPILTDMSVGSAISMLMIPTMLIAVYLNTACFKIPDLYKEQFDKRALRFPTWLFKLFSVLGGLCALIIAVTLFKDLTFKDAIVAVFVVGIPLIFSYIALKTKAVDPKELEQRKQEIIQDALLAEEY